MESKEAEIIEQSELHNILKEVYAYLKPASGSITGVGRLLQYILKDIFREHGLTDIQQRIVLREIIIAFIEDGILDWDKSKVGIYFSEKGSMFETT